MPLIPEIINDRKLWVILSTIKNKPNHDEIEDVRKSLAKLQDKLHAKGRFIWTGRFNDDKTSMAIFEATIEKARTFYEKYNKICSKILDSKMYQWDALPLFSILERIQDKV